MFQRLLKPLKSRSFLLFGPRGAGKTFWLRESFSPSRLRWFDLLNPAVEDRLTRNPQIFLQELSELPSETEWVIVDEVQKVPALLNLVHLKMNEGTDLKFALTGSSARKLKRGSANLLAGRASVYHLSGLTHSEWGKQFSLFESLRWGDLPTVGQLETNEEKKEYLMAYALTYLKEEIQMEQLIRNIPPFRKFLEIAAQMNGKVINYSKIARDIGVDYKTVQTYYEILEETFVGFFLPPHSNSLRKQQRKMPKFYFFDLGVTRALNRTLDINITEKTRDFGDSFEHYLIKEILSLSLYRRDQYRFSYLLTSSGQEVDLIVERPGLSDLFIEIKTSTAVPSEQLKFLKTLQSENDSIECVCLCREQRPRKDKDVRILPWQQGLTEYFSS